MTTQRRVVGWTIAVGLVALLLFVPSLRDHRALLSTIGVVYLAVMTAVGFIRGKPEGIRFFVLSVLVALLAVPLLFVAFWVNVWLGLAFVVLVPTMALAVAYRRDRRAATN